MALNTQITDLAQSLSSSLLNGSGSLSGSLGGGGAAFSWGGTLPTLANYVEVFTVDGMSFPVSYVNESDTTPAAIVAPGGPKPAAAAVTTGTVTLKKNAGKITGNLEAFVDSRNLANAMALELNRSCLKSFDKDAVATLAAGAGQTVTGATDWVAAISSAQGKVLAEGGLPGVVVVSAADYGAMLGDLLPLQALVPSPDGVPGRLVALGSALHVSSGAPAGTAYVLDPAAVQAAQSDRGVLVLLDPFSGSGTNVVTLVLDLLAVTFINAPAGVVKITAPVGTATAAARSGKRDEKRDSKRDEA